MSKSDLALYFILLLKHVDDVDPYEHHHHVKVIESLTTFVTTTFAGAFRFGVAYISGVKRAFKVNVYVNPLTFCPLDHPAYHSHDAPAAADVIASSRIYIPCLTCLLRRRGICTCDTVACRRELD